MKPLVTIVIVTFNSRQYLAECLESVRRQTLKSWELIVIDNASTDGTAELLRSIGIGRVIENPRNSGFCAAQNQGIKMGSGSWVLVLNPDVELAPDFVEKLLDASRGHEEAGVLCGKLLRWQPHSMHPFSSVIDSTGMYFRPDLRHLDRGAGETDYGQFDRREYVFGATGAAALYRRSMIEDISVAGEFFDNDFFAYREDADVAWRAQLMGWKCLYVPEARGWHVRRVTPERRNELPKEINWHSAKNRFLMRMKNAGTRLLLTLMPQMLARDLLIAGYAALIERNLLSALMFPLRNWSRTWAKRKSIQSRRRVPDRDLIKWFNYYPAAEPIGVEIKSKPQLKAG
jgi:GT2 family glycosyltransferase